MNSRQRREEAMGKGWSYTQCREADNIPDKIFFFIISSLLWVCALGSIAVVIGMMTVPMWAN